MDLRRAVNLYGHKCALDNSEGRGGVPELGTLEIQTSVGITNHHYPMGVTLTFAKWAPNTELIRSHKAMATKLIIPEVRSFCRDQVKSFAKLTNVEQKLMVCSLAFYVINKYCLVKNEQTKCKRCKGRTTITKDDKTIKCPSCDGTGISKMTMTFLDLFKLVEKGVKISKASFYRNYAKVVDELSFYLGAQERKAHSHFRELTQ